MICFFKPDDSMQLMTRCHLILLYLQVMSNCDSIPEYTPVAIFTFGHYVSGTAGIFTGCLQSGAGFKVSAYMICVNIGDCAIYLSCTDCKKHNSTYPGKGTITKHKLPETQKEKMRNRHLQDKMRELQKKTHLGRYYYCVNV